MAANSMLLLVVALKMLPLKPRKANLISITLTNLCVRSKTHLGLPATKIICVPAIGPAHYQTILISSRITGLDDTKPLGPLKGNSLKLYSKSPWRTTGWAASHAELIKISDVLETFYFLNRLILSIAPFNRARREFEYFHYLKDK